MHVTFEFVDYAVMLERKTSNKAIYLWIGIFKVSEVLDA